VIILDHYLDQHHIRNFHLLIVFYLQVLFLGVMPHRLLSPYSVSIHYHFMGNLGPPDQIHKLLVWTFSIQLWTTRICRHMKRSHQQPFRLRRLAFNLGPPLPHSPRQQRQLHRQKPVGLVSFDWINHAN